MKAIRKIPIIRILLCLLVLATLVSGSVFAHYVSSFHASDEAKVAPLDIEVSLVKAVGTNGATVTGSLADGFNISLTDIGQKISFELKITNRSHVDVRCTPSLGAIGATGAASVDDLKVATSLLRYNANGEPLAVTNIRLNAATFDANGVVTEATSTTVFLEVHSIPTNKVLTIIGTFNTNVDIVQLVKS